MTLLGDLVTLKRVVNLRPATRSTAAPGKHLATVLVFPVPRSDVGLVQGLRAGRRDAVQAVCDRYGAELLRIAMRVLGPDAPLTSVVSAAVSRAIDDLSRLENPSELRHWLICQLVAMMRQRLRAARRVFGWVRLVRGQDSARSSDSSGRCGERQRQTYRRLDRLQVDERIAFCLSRLDGMEPSEVATAMGSSVARVRRLLERSDTAFERLSAH